MSRSSSWIRRTACALTAAHLVIFAAAPFLETGIPAGAPRSATITNAASQTLVARVHDAGTCPACVLLSAHASQTNASGLAAVAPEVDTRVFAAPAIAPQIEPQPGFLSRAPPATIA